MMPLVLFHLTKGVTFRKCHSSWSRLCRTYYSSSLKINSPAFKIKDMRLKWNSQIKFLSLSIPTNNLICEELAKRSLLHITGAESSTFLQGLITNDINSLTDVMYSLMLNTQGRVLYDIILYDMGKSQEQGYFIECDTAVKDELQKHLKMYKLRKNIEITNVDSDFRPWVVLPLSSNIQPEIINQDQVIICVKDPRLDQLGWRLVCKKGVKGFDVLNHSVPSSNGCHEYYSLRYQLGIGEGVDDLPVGNCFPLESNGDYLHGVSFRKGCYIGQELTARTFHTGVVRKRLMPIVLEETTSTIPSDTKIKNENGKNVGKFRQAYGKFGLAVLRISESLASKTLSLEHANSLIKLSTSVPSWWPSSDADDQT